MILNKIKCLVTKNSSSSEDPLQTEGCSVNNDYIIHKSLLQASQSFRTQGMGTPSEHKILQLIKYSIVWGRMTPWRDQSKQCVLGEDQDVQKRCHFDFTSTLDSVKKGNRKTRTQCSGLHILSQFFEYSKFDIVFLKPINFR